MPDWILTDEEIMDAQGATGVKILDDKARAIATAAVKKYREWARKHPAMVDKRLDEPDCKGETL